MPHFKLYAPAGPGGIYGAVFGLHADAVLSEEGRILFKKFRKGGNK
jgi:hypothetical protein